ncbi:MAG: acyltransferase [Candidatus Korobacteraceae bacterium]
MSGMGPPTIPASSTDTGRIKEASFYRPELDALRFFAFLGVYLFHSLSHDPGNYTRYHLPPLASELMAAIATSGRFGGQLFFLLSGYLITSLLLRERWVTGHVNLRAFYIRRMLRIWPLYFFVLLLAVLWPWAGARLPLPYFVAYLLLAGNWMTVFLGPPASWASVLWPLPILQQFYLLWAPVIKYFSRAGRLYVAVALVVLANIVRYYLAVGALRPYTVFANTFAELDAIAAGILCALALKGSVPRFSTGQRLLLVYIGLTLLLGCGYLGRVETLMFIIAGYPFAVAGCLALFLAVCGMTFTFKPLIYLGKISYGLYVYHLLALLLVGIALGGKTDTPARFLLYWFGGLGLTIGLASASYRWLESPFLRRKVEFTAIQSRTV